MDFLLLAAAAAVSAPIDTGESVLAALKAEAETYQPRAACSVTVTAAVDSDGSDGPTDEELVFRFDHVAENWTVIGGSESQDDDQDNDDQGERPAPQDWYNRALMIAAAADRVEMQDDTGYILYTENLAEGTLINDGRDNSKRSRAETTVAVISGAPQITGYTVALKKPFRIPLIVRVRDFREEVVFGAADAYGPLATSRVNSWDLSFTGGSERGTAALTYTDYDCPA
ncbi:MAG: hypothetical protein AAGA39_02670 [Pseudomonadota bacterium]